jgi:manganese/zinc/iron transport system permease protein
MIDTNALWIILTGAIIAINCSILGSFLMLRKMAMLADAISHAVLPGIVIAFFITGDRSNIPMLIGAAMFGLFTVFVIEFLSKKIKLQNDAAIGVTFTFLFALGIILISLYAGQVDLDQDCVLYGEIAYVPLDLIILDNGWQLGPTTLVTASVLLLIILLGLRYAYKGFYITTFNPDYAISLGISAGIWQYVLMGAVSVNTVVSFEAVGAILVVAFIIVPPATAYLLTHSFKKMIAIACLIGVVSSAIGYYLASWLNSSISASMAVVAGFFFLLALLFGPKGYFTKKKNKELETPYTETAD